MFKRSRKKIIISIMGSLVLLFAVTLSVLLIANYREVRRNNQQMLARFVEMYQVDETMPEAEPDRPRPDGENWMEHPMDDKRDFKLSTFYAVAFAEDGSVLKVDTGEKNIYSEEELEQLARQVLEDNKTSGRTGSLSYMVSQKGDYTLVAFMDTTVSESGLRTLLHNVLLVGGGAIVLMFFVSLYLSKRIIQPLEENDRLQKQFISDASHELKTPVAVIGANAELLSRELGPNEWLSNIEYENERMGELVRQLLDLSRAENTETEMAPVDLSRVVTGETLVFESLAFENGKILQSDVQEGIHLQGNETQLQQLVSILLDNAMRHATGQEIGLSLTRQGRTAVLSVVNEADPIPKEQMEHLFDRFYRVDESRSDEGHHYGLGLSIAKAVAEKHGGSIQAECQNGQVRFTVTLPEKN